MQDLHNVCNACIQAAADKAAADKAAADKAAADKAAADKAAADQIVVLFRAALQIHLFAVCLRSSKCLSPDLA